MTRFYLSQCRVVFASCDLAYAGPGVRGYTHRLRGAVAVADVAGARASASNGAGGPALKPFSSRTRSRYYRDSGQVGMAA